MGVSLMGDLMIVASVMDDSVLGACMSVSVRVLP